MAEKDRQRRSRSAERRATESRQRAEKDRAALDNPEIPDEPSEIRNGLYFVAVVVFGIVLNLVVLVVVSGGQ
ncbi:MAG: hypothetical protein FIA92_13430 [Chloroflexi bacterium]|nr:hypothetical protein [Chloroflexota bacterium]